MKARRGMLLIVSGAIITFMWIAYQGSPEHNPRDCNYAFASGYDIQKAIKNDEPCLGQVMSATYEADRKAYVEIQLATTEALDEARDYFPCPAGRSIKGNLTTQSGDRIYHVPGGAFYDATKAEECFATEADARAAGYRRSLR